MTLGEYIRAYRTAHGLSQRQFAIQCAVSNGYISMIENRSNPKTNEPIKPTAQQLKKLANGMGITLHELLSNVDDIDLQLFGEPSAPPKSEVTDDDIKFALFGGAGEITDAMYDEVKRFAAYVKARETT